MARSKLVETNEKIAAGVTSGFRKMSDTVVGAYTRIEDRFVDQYLRREDESVEEAKARLKKEDVR